MKFTSLLVSVGLAAAFSIGTAHANLLIAYNPDGVANNFQVGLFSDTGTLLRTYGTGFGNGQHVIVDDVGNGYFADASTGVYKYDLATGVGGLLYNDATPIGLGFNSTRPGEILVALTTGVVRINSNSGATLATLSGGVYYDAFYNPVANQVIAAYNGTSAQTLDPVSLALSGATPVITGSIQATTSLAGVLYFAGNTGEIRNESNALIYTFGGASPNAYDISNNGTNLIAADYSNGVISTFTTGGTLVNSFDLGSAASGVAFTAIPEPSTYALFVIAGLAVLVFRRRRAA